MYKYDFFINQKQGIYLGLSCVSTSSRFIYPRLLDLFSEDKVFPQDQKNTQNIKKIVSLYMDNSIINVFNNTRVEKKNLFCLESSLKNLLLLNKKEYIKVIKILDFFQRKTENFYFIKDEFFKPYNDENKNQLSIANSSSYFLYDNDSFHFVDNNYDNFIVYFNLLYYLYKIAYRYRLLDIIDFVQNFNFFLFDEKSGNFTKTSKIDPLIKEYDLFLTKNNLNFSYFYGNSFNILAEFDNKEIKETNFDCNVFKTYLKYNFSVSFFLGKHFYDISSNLENINSALCFYFIHETIPEFSELTKEINLLIKNNVQPSHIINYSFNRDNSIKFYKFLSFYVFDKNKDFLTSFCNLFMKDYEEKCNSLKESLNIFASELSYEKSIIIFDKQEIQYFVDLYKVFKDYVHKDEYFKTRTF